MQEKAQSGSGMHASIVSTPVFLQDIRGLKAPNSTGPEAMTIVRAEYLRLRNEQQDQTNTPSS